MSDRIVVYEGAPALGGGDRRLLSAVSLLVLVGLWEAATRLQLVSPLFLPPPTAVAREAVGMVGSGELGRHLGVSLLRIGLGFVLGAAAGTALGLLLGTSRVVEAVGNPLIAATYPIPKIALLPLMILWLGIGEAPKVAMIALGVFFPVVINTYAGVRDTEPLMVKAATSLGAVRRQVLVKVILPSALPMILAGYRLGAGIALLLVVSAEMINATTGIGFLILHAGDLMLTGKLMVGLVLLSLLGLASTWGLRALEAYLVPWKEDFRR
ncbi:MAG TPA: ABC transporter permease [Methylomirabilota bacterium]|jgi:NitT/TauT family transport system permease protein|nr:ABC transporter permease [Methylomirabilota bacterium]